jgi:bacillithiol biosynthesis cysteine-adding enzyme BshC
MSALAIRLEHLPADVLGLEPIARAALAEGPAFAPIPLARTPREVPRCAERHSSVERAELARGLRRGLEPLEPDSRVEASLQALEHEGVFAVVAGQQPGFLASPLYTLYKAMQTCRLAHELALQWGRPVVPMFWNHGDDHDVGEVHHAYLVNRNLDLQKVALASLSSGRIPISRIVLDEERHRLGALRSALAQMFEETAHVDEALRLFLPRPGETLVRALTRALTALLGERGLVVVEPDWLRGALSRALARVIASDPLAKLERGADELRAEGLPVAIEPREAALVFRVDDDGRRPLRAGGDGFRYDGEEGSRTAAELAAEIQEEPERWSAGALLRPLVQDLVLPSATTIGGAGELAYHAELGPLRAALGLPRLPFVTRISFTLVDPEARAALAKVDLELRDVLERRGELGARAEETPVPEAITRMRESTQTAVELLLRHEHELAALDPSFGPNLRRAASQVRSLIEKLCEKAERVHANRIGKGARHLRRLSNTLHPRGQPQERVLGPFQFTSRFGRAWVDALYAEMPAIASEHVVVHLASDTPSDPEQR